MARLSNDGHCVAPSVAPRNSWASRTVHFGALHLPGLVQVPRRIRYPAQVVLPPPTWSRLGARPPWRNARHVDSVTLTICCWAAYKTYWREAKYLKDSSFSAYSMVGGARPAVADVKSQRTSLLSSVMILGQIMSG